MADIIPEVGLETDPLQPKVSPSGLVTTATSAKEAAPEFTPPAPTIAQGASAPASVVPQTQQPVAPPGENLEGRFLEEALGDTSVGAFQPGSLGEIQAVERGSAGDAFSQAFDEGILGFMFKDTFVPTAERDRINASVSNFAAENGWTNFGIQMAGGLASDLPIDVALLLGTGGLGNLMKLGGRSALIGSKALSRIDKGVDGVQKALKANRFQRAGLRFGYEAGIGGAAAVISEGIQSSLGKDVRTEDVVNRATVEALASGVFSELIRGGVKAFKGTRNFFKKTADDINTTVKEDTGVDPELSADDVEDALARQPEVIPFDEVPAQRTTEEPVLAEPGVEPEGTPRQEAEAEVDARQLADQAEDVQVREEVDPAVLTDAAARLEAEPSIDSLEGVFRAILRDEDAQFSRGAAELLDARAKASGLEIGEYIARKGLDFADSPDKAKIVINEGLNELKTIIRAPLRATSLGSLVHEIGHLIRSDIDGDDLVKVEKWLNVQNGRWTRQQEEQFANGFVEWLSEGKAPRAAPKSLVSAIESTYQKLADWLTRVFGTVYGGDRGQLTGEVREVFDSLFTGRFDSPPSDVLAGGLRQQADPTIRAFARSREQITGTPELTTLADAAGTPELGRGNVPTAAKERAVGKSRIEEQAAELESPEQAVSAEDKAKLATQKVQQELEDATVRAGGDKEGFVTGDNFARTSKVKRLNKASDTLPRLVTSDNIDVFSWLKGAGDYAKKTLMRDHIAGARQASDLYNTMGDAFQAKVEAAGITNQDMIKFANETEALGVKMTVWQKIKLKQLAMDGFDAKKEKVKENSAQETLTEKGSGVEVDGKKKILTEAELKEVQSDDFLTDKEQAMADAITEAYRAAQKPANTISQKLAGTDVLPVDNAFYSPKRVIDDATDFNFEYNTLLSGQGQGSGLGFLKARRGNATLKLENPLAELEWYRNVVADGLGRLEANAKTGAAIQGNLGQIKDGWGQNVADSMGEQVKVLLGKRNDLFKDDKKLIGKVLNLQALSVLSWNPSVVLKQFGSVLSAGASRVLKKGALVAASKAALKRVPDVKTLRNISGTSIVKEMTEHSSWFRRRLESNQHNIELADISNMIGGQKVLGRDLTAADLMALFKERKAEGLTTAIAEAAEKGMQWIKSMDTFAMSVIWDAAKRSVDSKLEVGSKAYWDAVDDMFIEVAFLSQPTTDTVTRSLNQMKTDLTAKAFTRFTTQTRKNYSLAKNGVIKFLNGPNTKETRKELGEVLIPLMIQTAYISAAGATAGAGIGLVQRVIESDAETRRKQRMNRRFGGVFKNSINRLGRDFLGQVPIVGTFAADTLSAVVGKKGFELTLPGIGEVQKITDTVNEAVRERDVTRQGLFKVLKSMGQLSGAPQLPFKLTESAVSRITD